MPKKSQINEYGDLIVILEGLIWLAMSIRHPNLSVVWLCEVRCRSKNGHQKDIAVLITYSKIC